MAGKGSTLGRLLRGAAWLVGIALLASVLAVASLRWINPPFTAFMAEAQVAAWTSRDPNYAFRHSWVDLGRDPNDLTLR